MRVGAKLLSAGVSDPGRVRRVNEDRIHVDAERGVFLVVDGLGGHAAGEMAAQTGVEMIAARLQRQTGTTEVRIREAIAVANNEIYRLAHEQPEWTGMACVVTLAVVEDDQLTVGHVGDSRLYLLEPGSIRKLTHDHSPVGEREDAGELNEASAMAHPRRNEVFRDLGNEEHGPDDPDFIEVVRHNLQPASALLLCSDGLSDQVPAAAIRSIVEMNAGDPEAAARQLVAAANEAGGKDNVSVVVVETPEYAARAGVRAPAAQPSRRGVHPLWALLGGVLLSLLAVALLKPHFVMTPEGPKLGFGVVRTPITWKVTQSGPMTLAQALARAAAGDTVLVEPGTYRENVRLRDGISLASSQRHGAVLDAAGVVVLAENVHGARLTGFRIMGEGETGIRIANSNVEVTGVEVSGMRDLGIDIEGESGGVIRASTIEGNEGGGIRIHGAAHPLISHNVITANGKRVTKLRPGLEIAGSASPVVTANIISENGAEQVWISPLFDLANLAAQNVIAPGVKDRNRQVKVVTR